MRPLRPLALGWTAFGVLPWIAVGVEDPSVVEVATWVPAVAALVAVGWVVKDRLPVRRPRLAHGAASAVFLLGLVRWAVLPSMARDVALMGTAAGEARLAQLTLALWAVRAGFVAACVTLAWVCLAELRRVRSGAA